MLPEGKQMIDFWKRSLELLVSQDPNNMICHLYDIRRIALLAFECFYQNCHVTCQCVFVHKYELPIHMGTTRRNYVQFPFSVGHRYVGRTFLVLSFLNTCSYEVIFYSPPKIQIYTTFKKRNCWYLNHQGNHYLS